MRLRTRIGLLVGVTVALSVAAVTLVASWSARDELFGPVDERLAGRLSLMQALTEGDEDLTRGRPLVLAGSGIGRIQRATADDVETTALLVVRDDGVSLEFPGVELPLSVHETFSPEGAEVVDGVALFDVDVGEQHLRVGRAELGDAVVYLGYDVSGLDDGLASLRSRLLLIGAAGVVAAVAVAWFIAHRLARPVTAVAAAAGQLAETSGDVPARIQSRRRDEVGDLASSFNRLLDALATSREQQSRLVSDASHELRTPLTSLRLRIEAMAEHPDMDPARRAELVDAAVRELGALGALVEELVDLATDVEQAEEPLVEMALGAAVADAVEHARLRTGRRLELTTDNAVAEVAPRLYGRAVANLIDNALKYSPADQPVVVVQEGASVEVLDRGHGVGADELPFVFDRFYRSPSARLQPGSGIGLAIVAYCASHHGGEAWFVPRPNGGSRVGFWVTAPALSGDAAAQPTTFHWTRVNGGSPSG